ncbi:hypothetical protein [Bradyrhizobium sp. STM 3557]|uniref:hypothetical protein n=1 Tax=Bradyrhizobium sp. STM 3557 TaxID=578920 RepID=UPI00388CF69C
MASSSDPADLAFDAVVEVDEKLGSEILLDLKVGPVTGAVEPTVRAEVGDQLRLALNPTGCTYSTVRRKQRSDGSSRILLARAADS